MVGMRGAELNTQRTAVEGFEDGIYKKILGLLPEFCTQLTAMIAGVKFSFNPADRGWETAALQPGLSLGINQPKIVFNI